MIFSFFRRSLVEMAILPESLVNKIMTYVSHPVADLLKPYIHNRERDNVEGMHISKVMRGGFTTDNFAHFKIYTGMRGEWKRYCNFYVSFKENEEASAVWERNVIRNTLSGRYGNVWICRNLCRRIRRDDHIYYHCNREQLAAIVHFDEEMQREE